VYGYPVKQVARTVLQTVLRFLCQHKQPVLTLFALFDAGTHKVFSAALQAVQVE